MTLANASANNMLIDLLKDQLMLKDALLSVGEFFYIYCRAQILNLIVHHGLSSIVQYGLKKIADLVEKTRERVKYVRGS